MNWHDGGGNEQMVRQRHEQTGEWMDDKVAED